MLHSNYSCRAPILLLAFNRPHETAQVLTAIRKVKPSRVYLSVDGPRPNVPGEIDLCKSVQSLVSMIDWVCEVKMLFSDNNLGCKKAVNKALDWFFA